MTRIAILQMTSGIDPEANCAAIEDAAVAAAKAGATMLFTPEMSLLLDRKRSRSAPWIESSGPQVMAERLHEAARQNGIDIALGSIPIAAGGQPTSSGRWANRSIYCPATTDAKADAKTDGGALQTYDKMHMFDVDLDSGESWRESKAYQPGDSLGIIEDTPLGRLGLTICYDLRFPALFDALGRAACDAIAVPAAFTVPTGEAHWHVLLRARAIEASAFVIAAAQVGTHEDGRTTYGHSLVVDPWGTVLLDMGGEAAGLAYVDLDLSRIAEVRSQIPSLANKRPIAT